MRSRYEQIVTGILAASAVAVALSAAHLSFIKEPGRRELPSAPPDLVASWRDALPYSRTVVGDSSAAITILTLVDFECPACARMHQTLHRIADGQRGKVRLVYVNYPLSYHRFGWPAARAAECAAAFGRYDAFVAALYERQDSLGLRAWGAYASDAGVSDTAAIRKCATSLRPIATLDSGYAFGKRIGARSLPTVIVNGWRFSRLPSEEDLLTAIKAIEAGGSPR